MATVYRAFDTVLEVDRAIKLLAPTLLARASIRQRFASEARTMARLRHPNIVTVYDVCNDDQGFYIIMEYIASGSVDDRVQHFGPLPPQMACDVIIALLNGLTVAHAQNVVHRDIKPHNLLVTTEGIPKLTDFGIAHVAEKDRALTSTGMVMGTLAYMSPEQKMSARKADARADLYSSAATMYALMTNDEPFDLFSPPVQDEKFVDLPDPIANLLRKACEYKPENRYQTAEEMIAALEACKAELPPDPADTPDLALPPEIMSERTVEITKEFTTGHNTDSTEQGTLPPRSGATGSLSQPTFFDLDDGQSNNTVDMSALSGNTSYLPEGPDQTSDTLHPLHGQQQTAGPAFITTPLGLFVAILLAAGTAAGGTVAFNKLTEEPAQIVAPASIQQALEAKPTEAASTPKPAPGLVEEPVVAAPIIPAEPKANPKPKPKPKPVVQSAPAIEAPKATPAPAGPPKGIFKVSGKVSEVKLKRRGKYFDPGQVAIGLYDVWANINGEGLEDKNLKLQIETGKTHTVSCQMLFNSCKEE